MEVQKNNMKNIFRVFANDWKRIGRNVVALVVVMGLSVLPSLYAWFNILSNWDPYGSDSTSNIKVAVAYDDTGIDISGMNVNISTNIIEALKTNDTIGWVFTDTSEEAIEGVWAGDYYAALIMPEDFSRDMVSFLADNMTHPEIIYYTNQKKNAIAPKITDKAKTAVQQQVNATFISSLTEAIMKSADIADNIGAIKDSDGNTINKEHISGNSILDILIAKLQVVNTQVSTFDSVLTAVSNIISTAQSTSDTAAAISPDLSVKFDSEKAILNELNNTIGKSNLIDSTIFANIANDINTIQGYMNSVSEIYDDMGYNVADFDNSISQMGSSIANTSELVHNLENQLSDSITKLVDFKSSGTYSLLQTAVAFNTEELASFISAPVTIGTVDLYPIENYGSAMSHSTQYYQYGLVH
jgi:YhgE/Pip-like protein